MKLIQLYGSTLVDRNVGLSYNLLRTDKQVGP